jgi:hypothetical protein
MDYDLSGLRRVRIFTTWETTLYVDTASGQLRHGPIRQSPANVFFVVEPDSSQEPLRGWLAHERGSLLNSIACFSDRCISIADEDLSAGSNVPTRFQLIELERGLVGFEADGIFLCAQPDGRIALENPWCSLWEFFLLSEHPCEAFDKRNKVGRNLKSENISSKIDKHQLRSFIVDPLLRARAMKGSSSKSYLIFGYTKWSHGRVNYDLCTHLWEKGFVVDLLDWHRSYLSSDVEELKSFYHLFITSFDLDGIRILSGVYGVPYERIIAISHSDFFAHDLEEYRRFAGYGVVSYSLLASSLSLGIPRIPDVVSLGVNYDEFYAEPSSKLATLGYATSMSLEWMKTGIDRKRGELARECAEGSGLEFKTAASGAGQTSFHDMPEFYRTVDCVLMTSLFEAAPLPVLEAAAAGRLVIGTPVGHFPLLAYQGAGIIAPVDARQFKKFTIETLRYYKENPGEYTRKCRSIQESARKLDWQFSIEQWVALLEGSKAP